MKISILKQTPTVFFISDQLNLKKIYSFVPPPPPPQIRFLFRVKKQCPPLPQSYMVGQKVIEQQKEKESEYTTLFIIRSKIG